ncbi:RNA polymerase-binding protein DksA, partial [Neisseria sp. P0006.S005]
MAKLTEQDILIWDGPEEDYMNRDQLAFFRELLVSMLDELIENATAWPGQLRAHVWGRVPAGRG